MMQALQNFYKNRHFIVFEFLVLCISIPAYIIYTKSAPFMFGFLWGAALYGLVVLRLFYRDHLRQIWRWRQVTWVNMKPILLRWLVACAAMVVFIYFYDPDRMFRLLLDRPGFIPFLLIAYPLISALPQELIFCSFFFERYKPLFGEGHKMVLASAIIFAYAHILYINPIAPTLSLIGGLIFALTYMKTKSLALVTIEHGLYGNFLFVVGLGWYFYGGSVAVQ